jgi:polyferredoxin
LNIKSFILKIKNRRITTTRRVVQILAFIIINYVILEQVFVLNLISLDAFLKVLPVINAPKNPISRGTGILEMIFYSIVEGIFPLFLIAVLILILLFTNRFFCGWICPVGTIQDVCAAIPTEKKRLKINTHNSLLKIKYGFVILIVILIIPLGITATTNYDFYLDYRANLGDFGKNPMGYFSLSEYIFIVFPNMIKDIVTTRSLQPLFPNFLVLFIFFFYLAIIVLAVWYPRVYCRYLCPFAAVSSVISEYSFLKLTRNPVRCVGRTECGICEKVCPKQIRMLDEHFEFFTGNGECNFCLKCKEHCPYNAIDMKMG